MFCADSGRSQSFSEWLDALRTAMSCLAGGVKQSTFVDEVSREVRHPSFPCLIHSSAHSAHGINCVEAIRGSRTKNR